jgi:hypothetical protein
MSATRPGTAGATRTCPHCKAKILDSATICPVCRHYLRFDPGAAERETPTLTPLNVEGAIRPPAGGEPWEYSVMVTVRNERGEEIARHAVDVGALQPNEERTFTLSVEVFTPGSTIPR